MKHISIQTFALITILLPISTHASNCTDTSNSDSGFLEFERKHRSWFIVAGIAFIIMTIAGCVGWQSRHKLRRERTLRRMQKRQDDVPFDSRPKTRQPGIKTVVKTKNEQSKLHTSAPSDTDTIEANPALEFVNMPSESDSEEEPSESVQKSNKKLNKKQVQIINYLEHVDSFDHMDLEAGLPTIEKRKSIIMLARHSQKQKKRMSILYEDEVFGGAEPGDDDELYDDGDKKRQAEDGRDRTQEEDIYHDEEFRRNATLHNI